MAQAGKHDSTKSAARGQFAEAVLRDILNSADVLGDSPTGGTYLLVEADRGLLDALYTYGADVEDMEEDDPAGGNPEDEGENQADDLPGWLTGTSTFEPNVGQEVRPC